MKREERLTLTKEIIENKQIATQEELQEILRSQGIFITQATLSRDIRELNIIKKRENGKSFYSLLPDVAQVEQSDLQLSFGRFVVKVAHAGFMVVIHTHLGEADMLANVLDDEARPEILGTLAGADTLLVTCLNEYAAQNLVAEIQDAL